MKVDISKSSSFKLPTHCLSLARGEDNQFYAACFDGGIYALPQIRWSKPNKLAEHRNYASGVNWSRANRELISSGYDGHLLWINPDKKQTTREIKAHEFWSWQSTISPNGKFIASSTGQYLCGGYKYEPAQEKEPSIRVYEVLTGREAHHFPHIPPVESVAFSNDGKFLAAGNLMGEVRIWNLETEKETARIQTGNFTGWGVIKGHYFTGGIFSLAFSPDDSEILLAGMGSTRDPAAGNGKQLWERWKWRDGSVERTGSANDSEIGQGLMETLAIHPGGKIFAMAGRLFKGQWNTAIFDLATGSLLAATDTKMRVSKAVWNEDGTRLYLGGSSGQPKEMKDIEKTDWGKVKVLKVSVS